MLDKKEFVKELLELQDEGRMVRFIEDNLPSLDRGVIDLITEQAEEALSSNPAQALKMVAKGLTAFIIIQAGGHRPFQKRGQFLPVFGLLSLPGDTAFR